MARDRWRDNLPAALPRSRAGGRTGWPCPAAGRQWPSRLHRPATTSAKSHVLYSAKGSGTGWLVFSTTMVLRIDGGDILDQLCLVAGNEESGKPPRPHEDDGGLGVARGRDGGGAVGGALLRRVPGKTNLHRRVRRIGAHFRRGSREARRRGRWRGATLSRPSRGGNHIVLVGLEDVAMDIALESAGDAHALAVDIKSRRLCPAPEDRANNSRLSSLSGCPVQFGGSVGCERIADF